MLIDIVSLAKLELEGPLFDLRLREQALAREQRLQRGQPLLVILRIDARCLRRGSARRDGRGRRPSRSVPVRSARRPCQRHAPPRAPRRPIRRPTRHSRRAAHIGDVAIGPFAFGAPSLRSPPFSRTDRRQAANLDRRVAPRAGGSVAGRRPAVRPVVPARTRR